MIGALIFVGALGCGFVLHNKFCPEDEEVHEPIIEKKEKFSFLSLKSKKEHHYNEKKRPSYYH